MSRRVFVVAGEYSAPPRAQWLGSSTVVRDYREHPSSGPVWEREMTRVFFRAPRSPSGWGALGRETPITLTDLMASAAHRTLCTLHELVCWDDYVETLGFITDILVTSMPGLATGEPVSPALIPQTLRALLRLPLDAQCQFVVGTSDSGAWAFANAVRTARDREATVLVIAGQVIPSGYAAQRQIRAVLGQADQQQGLDMLAVGDFLMDTLRRSHTDLSLRDVRDFLTDVRERKLLASQSYPATMTYGQELGSGPDITPYYTARDIAPACCGAASLIVTSDEALIAELLDGPAQSRFAACPITEVLGVGEGATNPNLTYRRTPMVFASSMRHALAAAADDAGMHPRSFPGCAFAVLHDAFPSIELALLLSIGLDFEEAARRMRSYWPNPYGGLLSFGHALGASGLVQICKAHHVLVGDSRYALPTGGEQDVDPLFRFPASGATAFAASVGGPISHIVVSILRGGGAHLERRTRLPPAPVSDFPVRRRLLRQAADAYRRRLGAERFVEGTTCVDLRSCLHAVPHDVLDRLPLEVIDQLVVDAHRAEARLELRAVLKVLDESRYGPSLREVVERWAEDGWLCGDAQAAVAAVKESLRIPISFVSAPIDAEHAREVVFLGPTGDLPGEKLPWWHHAAVRPDRPRALDAVADHAHVARLLSQGGGTLDEETASDVSFLRQYFAPVVHPASLRVAARRLAGPAASKPAESPILYFQCDIMGSVRLSHPHAAFETLAHAVHLSSGWLAMYERNLAQHGDSITMLCFEDSTRDDPAFERHAIAAAARFARDVAEWCIRRPTPIGIRIVAGIGHDGSRFQDVTDAPNASSVAATRAGQLRKRIKAMPETRPDQHRIPWIAFDVTDVQRRDSVASDVGAHLPGWTLHGGRIRRCNVSLGTTSVPCTYGLWYLRGLVPPPERLPGEC